MRILVIDDERNFRRAATVALESMGHEVTAVGDGASALEALAGCGFDLAMLDLLLGAENGIELLTRLLSAREGLAVVVMTAYASMETAVAAVRGGAVDYFPKPGSPDELRDLLARVGQARRDDGRAADPGGAAAGESPEVALTSTAPAMTQVLRQAVQAAQCDATTLLLGETGTGRYSLAREIHRQSRRAGKAFVSLHCSSFPASQLQGEGFGYVERVLVETQHQWLDKIHQAEGGTLYLDEVAELPPTVQLNLLRLLQAADEERAGEAQGWRADLRVIAATSTNLLHRVAERRFREDLYYRLFVVPITVPPLRQRICDLPQLAAVLLDFFSARLGKPRITLSPGALKLLQRHSWPGNLRELRNWIERMVILGTKRTIEAEDLEPRWHGAPEVQLGGRLTLAQIEAEHIRRVIASTASLEEAATVLEIDRATLYRKRKRDGSLYEHESPE